ncbi:M48 family metallopeptidase [soil metagenome]
MDFFEAQESARTRTRTLIVLFIAAVIAIIVAVYAVVHVALGPGPAGGVDPALLLLTALLVSALVAVGSTVRTMQLRQGGARVAELLGGRRVAHGSTDEAERRLINVVEEMAIASGTPMPAIYVLDHEEGINAFAAGYTIDDAAVAVTRGTLDRLNRDELQGVIAHEFSHILNGDMRLNIRLMGLLFGILLLAIVGRGLLYSGGRGRRRGGSGNQIAIVGLALVVVGYIGVFFGRLIQAAVSRQREYLADSAAVQFTRNPDGIAGALHKIGNAGSRLQDHHAQEASHLFFANGIGSAFTSLLATHPPLADRIRRLKPSLAGEAERAGVTAGPPSRGAGAGAGALAGSGAQGFTGGSVAGGGAATGSGPALMASIGTPGPEHVAYAGRLLNGLPPQVRDAAHEGEGAVALLFALLLHGAGSGGDDDGGSGDAQRAAIAEEGWADLLPRVDALLPHVRAAGQRARLPVLDLLLPSLRELEPAQQRSVRAAAQRLVAVDNRVDMFELALLHVLNRQLSDDGAPASAAASDGPRSLKALRDEIGIVLSAVAWSGTSEPGVARDTFSTGAASLQPITGELSLRPRIELSVSTLDGAFDRARHAALGVRRRLLEACMLTIAHDGRVELQEAEMLRAVAEAIDCPMPPALRA